MDGRIEPSRRREISCSSGRYTASSSLTSGASLRYPRLPDDVVPDGFPQEDFPAEFSQEEEEVKSGSTDLVEV